MNYIHCYKAYGIFHNFFNTKLYRSILYDNGSYGDFKNELLDLYILDKKKKKYFLEDKLTCTKISMRKVEDRLRGGGYINPEHFFLFNFF